MIFAPQGLLGAPLEPLAATWAALGDPGGPMQPLQFSLNSLSKSAPNQIREGESPAELHFEVTLPH